MIFIILSTGDLEVDANFEYITVSADDEEKHGYKGLNFSKTLRPRAEFKIYKLKVAVDSDLVKTFSPGTPKCATPERAREDL